VCLVVLSLSSPGEVITLCRVWFTAEEEEEEEQDPGICGLLKDFFLLLWIQETVTFLIN